MSFIMQRSLFISIIISLLLALNACGSKEEREAEYYQRAEKLFAQGDYLKAKVEIKNALQINPKNVDVRYLLAQIEEKNGNWRELYQNLSLVIEQQPEHMDAQVKLGLLLLLIKKVDEAQEKAEYVLARQPDNTNAHALRASVLAIQKDKQGSKAAAIKALALDPGQGEAISLLAAIYVEEQHPDKALVLLERGIKHNPDLFRLRTHRINLLNEMGEIDQAEGAFKQLITHYPEKPTLAENQGNGAIAK